MQKHITLAENAPVAHVSNNLTIGINSQHPYLLGFNSNLIPNFNILVFQPYLGEDSEYSEELRRFAHNSAPPLGNTLNIQEIHLDWSYFFLSFQRIQQGPLQILNTSSIHQIQREKTRIIGKIYIFVFRVHYRY